MDHDIQTIKDFLETVSPYMSLPQDELARVAGSFRRRTAAAGSVIYEAGTPLDGLFIVERGSVEVLEPSGSLVSLLGPRNSFGERGLLRDGLAATTARAVEESSLLLLPADLFRELAATVPAFDRFFQRGRRAEPREAGIETRKVGELMTRALITIGPADSIRMAAERMRDSRVSSLGVIDGARFVGIVTNRDLATRALAAGMDPAAPVSAVMTPDPVALAPDALGTDILHLMLEHRIGHLPVVDGGQLVGIITQTDLTRFQAVSSALLVRDASRSGTVAELAAVTARIPDLLMQLVGSSARHEVVTRLVTDIADAVTRRLLAMAEADLGPPPVPYLWLACGSQGRREQTGVSDQDNCLILDDAVSDADMAYFQALARFTSDGLDACGYVYCPEDDGHEPRLVPAPACVARLFPEMGGGARSDGADAGQRDVRPSPDWRRGPPFRTSSGRNA